MQGGFLSVNSSPNVIEGSSLKSSPNTLEVSSVKSSPNAMGMFLC